MTANLLQLNRMWTGALRIHAETPLMDDEGNAFNAIGRKTLNFMDRMWAERRTPLPDPGDMIERGRTVEFWSDPHFGHNAIREMTNRTEFASVEQMDEAIWSAVTDAMSRADLVVCLGDLALKNSVACQRRLHSMFGDRHFAIVGNHDIRGATPTAWLTAGAAASLAFSLPLGLLRQWMEEDHGDLAEHVRWDRLPGDIKFGCSHWPVPVDRLPGADWVCLHGHTHNRPPGRLRVNFSVEMTGYRPRTLRAMLQPRLFQDLVRRQSGLSGFRVIHTRLGEVDAPDATVAPWRRP